MRLRHHLRFVLFGLSFCLLLLGAWFLFFEEGAEVYVVLAALGAVCPAAINYYLDRSARHRHPPLFPDGPENPAP